MAGPQAPNPFGEVDSFQQMRDGMTATSGNQLGSVMAPPPAPLQFVQGAPVHVAYGGGPASGFTGTSPGQGEPGSTANGNGYNGHNTPYFNGILGLGGLTTTSGYRDPDHNAAVGGVPNSYHTKKDSDGVGRAMDFSGSAEAMQKGAEWARAHGATEALIHNAGSGQHLHVAW